MNVRSSQSRCSAKNGNASANSVSLSSNAALRACVVLSACIAGFGSMFSKPPPERCVARADKLDAGKYGSLVPSPSIDCRTRRSCPMCAERFTGRSGWLVSAARRSGRRSTATGNSASVLRSASSEAAAVSNEPALTMILRCH